MKTKKAPPSSQFLLLLHQPAGDPPAPEKLKAIMKRFQDWMDQLNRKHAVLATNGLASTGKVLRGRKGSKMTDGPYIEGKEVVGGYVLLAAKNLQAALSAARACPGLDYNMAVEVRPVIGVINKTATRLID